MFRALTVWCLTLGLVLACVGCGGPASLPAVKGTVTYKGVPVEAAAVTFMDSSGKLAIGTTDAKGEFTLMTGTQPGAAPGTYKVGVVKRAKSADAPGAGEAAAKPEEMMKKMMMGKGKMPEAKHELPEKYAVPMTSPLSFEVKSDARQNDFKIELTD